MAIIRGTKEQIKEYFDSPAIGQSTLKLLINGNPRLFKEGKSESELYYEEKGHFVIGSGVDCILTQGRDVFDSSYHVQELAKCSATAMSIIKKAFDNIDIIGQLNNITYPLKENETWRQFIYESLNSHEYYMNRRKEDWKEDNRYTGLLNDNGEEYWKSLIEGKGKFILDQEQHNKIIAIANSLYTHPRTSKYFIDREGIDILFQVPIYFEYFGIKCKALPDILIIDHKNRRIILCDIKTLGFDVIDFPINLRMRRYDFQAAYYAAAVNTYVDNYPELNGYIIEPMRFIVESTINIGQPCVFHCNEGLIMMGTIGREEVKDDFGIIHKKIVGFQECLELYRFYEQHGWDIHKDIIEAEGEFEINWTDKFPYKTK
jgi:hypothetical protein